MKIHLRANLDSGYAEAEVPPLERVGDRLVPRAIDVHLLSVDGQPALDMRLEVVDGVPQCRELRLTSAPAGREVKPLDLAAIKLNDWLVDTFALFAPLVTSEDGSGVQAVFEVGGEVRAAQTMQQARTGRAARKITPQFLERVAEVYLADLDGAPTQAVMRAFGVQDRQARKYVKLAEEAGHLTEGEQGKIRRRADGKR